VDLFTIDADTGRNASGSLLPVERYKIGVLAVFKYEKNDSKDESCCGCPKWRQWYNDGKHRQGWTEETYCDENQCRGCLHRTSDCDAGGVSEVFDYPGPEAMSIYSRNEVFPPSDFPQSVAFVSKVFLDGVLEAKVSWYWRAERHSGTDYSVRATVVPECELLGRYN